MEDFGRLLRYVVRVQGGVNINLRLVGLGAAAPHFFDDRRGRYATSLETAARSARRQKLGLWKACPRTVYDPYEAIQTRR